MACFCKNLLELGVEGANSFLEGTKVLINSLIVPGCFWGKLSRFGQVGSERKRVGGSGSTKLCVYLKCLPVNILLVKFVFYRGR